MIDKERVSIIASENTSVMRIILRLLVVLLTCTAGSFVLYKHEFLLAFADIDNVVGMIPVALVLTAVSGIIALFWLKREKRLIPLFVTTALLVVLSVALFPTALRGDWWINTTISEESETTPDLSLYAPFIENSKTAKLDGQASIQLTEDMPVMDGALALYPLYAAFAEAVYDSAAFSQNDVLCTNTRSAYDAIIAGEVDVIFVANASEQQAAAAKAAGADLHFTPIGREAFVFLTGVNNPIEDISYQQIRNIYSGKTAEWATLGWNEGGKIIAFQRPEGSGSQTGLQWIMGDLTIQAPQPLPDASLIGTNSLMKQVSVEWNGVQPAIGYSYRYYAISMYPNPDAKLMKINGVYPSNETIADGSYPFASEFYAVTNGQPEGNIKELIDWILTDEGQSLIEQTGYAPLK